MARAGFNFALLLIVDTKFKNLTSLAQLAKFLYYFFVFLFFHFLTYFRVNSLVMYCLSGVHVTDMGVSPLSNSTTVTVNISPVNEFSPEFTHSSFSEVNVKENQATGNGLVLFNVNATDKDFGQQGEIPITR